MPEIPFWDMLLHSINEMCVDLIQHVEGEFIAGLAIGAGGLADTKGFFRLPICESGRPRGSEPPRDRSHRAFEFDGEKSRK